MTIAELFKEKSYDVNIAKMLDKVDCITYTNYWKIVNGFHLNIRVNKLFPIASYLGISNKELLEAYINTSKLYYKEKYEEYKASKEEK